jgi:protein ImuA
VPCPPDAALPMPRPAREMLGAADAATRGPTLAEVFAATATDGAATGFVLAHLAAGARVLWVQDRMTRREAGRPFPPGLPVRAELLHLEVARAADVLWAMEQGLGCPALAAVVGEVWGATPVLDFTATKRLALRAEAHGVAAWLVRRGAAPDLSAARERWRLASLPALAHPDDLRAPGAAQWRATLFRARWRAPAEWVAQHDRVTGQLVLGQAVAAQSVAAQAVAAQAGGRRLAG